MNGNSRPMFRRWLGRALKLLVLAGVAGFIIYRLQFAPVPVLAAKAVRSSLVHEVLGTGTLEARTSVTVSSKIAGRLTQILADQGDRIRQGQLLAALDDAEYRQQVEVASATLAAAKAGVERAVAEVARAEAGLRQAKSEYDRNESLRGTGAVSAQLLDRSTEQYQAALADLERAKAMKLESERQVAAGEQTLKYQQARLADTRITSPYDGLVIQRQREPGDIVVPGTPILQTISTDTLWISAWVDESAIPAIAPDQPARVVFRSEPDRSYPGKVARMAPLSDRETREFVVDVAITKMPGKWAIGQRAEVYIQTERRTDALAIPQEMLIWRGGKAAVLLDDHGAVRWRFVKTGLRGSGKIEVLEGLKPDDTVVRPREGSADSLRDGRALQLP